MKELRVKKDILDEINQRFKDDIKLKDELLKSQRNSSYTEEILLLEQNKSISKIQTALDNLEIKESEFTRWIKEDYKDAERKIVERKEHILYGIEKGARGRANGIGINGENIAEIFDNARKEDYTPLPATERLQNSEEEIRQLNDDNTKEMNISQSAMELILRIRALTVEQFDAYLGEMKKEAEIAKKEAASWRKKQADAEKEVLKLQKKKDKNQPKVKPETKPVTQKAGKVQGASSKDEIG